MKVLMVSEMYDPWIGGIAEHIRLLSAELRRRGHTVKVLTAQVGSRPADRDDADVHRIGRSVTVRANRSLSPIPVGWRMPSKVRQFCADFDPDIIHTHMLGAVLPTLALRYSRAVNVETFHTGFDRSTLYALSRPLLIRYFRKLHGRIAVSEAARRSMARYYPADYRIIPNGIDPAAFHPAAAPLPQFADGRPTVLHVGRLEPRKGLAYLLRALPLIRAEVPDVRLVVVGDGPLAGAYRRAVGPELRDSVVFVGRVPPGSLLMASYYRSAECFCAPSTGGETFGIVLLESMASGRPVVASDIDGYREVVEHGVEGYLCPPEDERALARAIISVLTDPAACRRMGDAGRSKALQYSWEAVGASVERYYCELVEGEV